MTNSNLDKVYGVTITPSPSVIFCLIEHVLKYAFILCFIGLSLDSLTNLIYM